MSFAGTNWWVASEDLGRLRDGIGVPPPPGTAATFLDSGDDPLGDLHTIDDQIEWLDDGTILYGMPRDGAVGDYDVWKLAADGSSEPSVFIEHAWSPSVVRGRG